MPLAFAQSVRRLPAEYIVSIAPAHRQRTLADLPMSGKRIKFLVRLRKFFYLLTDCPRKVFAQSCQSVFKPYARRLLRADQQIQTIGLQTGAKPGARLCHLTSQPVSASTVLRIIQKTPIVAVITPKRVGVDDFAFKKGRDYGTILTVRRCD